MIYIETGSTDVYYNFGLEYYFAAEKKLPEPVLLFWRTTPASYCVTVAVISGA